MEVFVLTRFERTTPTAQAVAQAHAHKGNLVDFRVYATLQAALEAGRDWNLTDPTRRAHDVRGEQVRVA